MCGIAGFLDLRRERPVDAAHIEPMLDCIVHRGPDSAGVHHRGHLALGIRRLSIVDLQTGDQPIYNEDRSLAVVCNGEIFNSPQLRDELEARGHRFQTRSDVEVLVHLYEEMGPDLVDRLEGQFAFAIDDSRQERLLLARDPFGVTPLFHAVTADGVFVFGSEIKSVLAYPGVERAVDLTGLDQVLCFPGLASPRTVFRGIHSLAAGHRLRVEQGEVREDEYWDLDYPLLGEEPPERDEAAYARDLAERFHDAVQVRLMADVELGFYLSGGLDSSLIAAAVAATPSGRGRHSFSITFDDEHISETRYQELMVEQVESIHHRIHFDWRHIHERLRRAVYHCECPIKETYNTCSLALSEAARAAGVTVVLTGEGSDELFGGYVGYRFDAGGLRGVELDPLEAAMEEELAAELWGDPQLFYEHGLLALQETKGALYAPHLRSQLPDFDCLRQPLVKTQRLVGRHPLHQRSYLDFKLRLADHLVGDHGDRMALANSVEARFPFLDRRLVELATTIPPRLKVPTTGEHAGEEKYILKRACGHLVPSQVLEREKFGFHAPGTPYLLQQGVDWIQDLLSPDLIRRQGYFDADVVERLKRQYSQPGFLLNVPFETDLLAVVLTFGILLEEFDLPDYT